jgi:tetratricopeptide (TPR) repeat protein
MPDTLVDYYALLGVARTASDQEIERAIKSGIRTWSKQTSRPELDKRQEAERKMEQLKKAREILLNGAQRQSYDQQLAAASMRPEVGAAAPSSSNEWLELAQRALSVNDYRTAVRAAQEAQSSHDRTAEVWGIMAEANAGLGRFDDAVFEAQRALQLDPDNHAYRYLLADIFEKLGDWRNAVAHYEQLARLEPDAELPQVGIGSVYISSGDYRRAISLFEGLYANGQNKEMAGDYLAMALMTEAEGIPALQDSTGYVITAPHEITRMRPLLSRAAEVTQDADLRTGIAQASAYVEQMAASEIIWQRFFGRWARRYVLVAVILIIIGLVTNSALLPILFILAGGVGLVAYARVPRWKLNSYTHQGRGVTY